MSSNATSRPARLIRIEMSSLRGSCRACLAHSEDMISIFGTVKQDIANMIEFCTGVLVKKQENLPSKICKVCRNNLSVAYKFKQSFLRADETLRKLLPTKIKTKLEYEVKNNKHEVSKTEFEVMEIKRQVNETKNESDSDVEFVSETNNVKIEYELDGRVSEDDIAASEALKAPKKPATKIRLKQDKANSKKTVAKQSKFTIPKPDAKKEKQNNNKVIKKDSRPLKKLKYKKLFCEPCNLSFENSYESRKHRKEKHDTEKFICEHCGKVSNAYATHYSHVRTHLPPRYGCEQCDYKTRIKQDLIKHIKIHIGVKEFQCEYCTRAYCQMSNLMRHIRMTHLKLRTHSCTLCDRKYFDSFKLKLHIESHKNIKRYYCEHCHSSFTRRCYWKKHLKQRHDIVAPLRRPGRQKTDLIVGDPHTKITYISKEDLSGKRQPYPPIKIYPENTKIDVKNKTKEDVTNNTKGDVTNNTKVDVTNNTKVDVTNNTKIQVTNNS